MKRIWKGIIVGVLIGATFGWFLGLFIATPFGPKWLDYFLRVFIWPSRTFMAAICWSAFSCRDIYWVIRAMRVFTVIFYGIVGGAIVLLVMKRKKIFGLEKEY